MKIFPFLTLIISIGLGLFGVLNLTQISGQLSAIAGLIGVAISGGALAICSSIEGTKYNSSAGGEISYAGSKEAADAASRQLEWDEEKARRAAIANKS